MDDPLTSQTLYSLSENGDTPPELPKEPPVGRPPEAPIQESEAHDATEHPPDSPTPFIVELRRADDIQGHFRPEASLIVSPVLRTGCLLQALPAEDLSSLLYMLTFLTPNGDIVPTVVELAHAMDIPERSVRYRMDRLVRFRWRGKPLAISLTRSSGLDAYMVSPDLITIRHAAQTLPQDGALGPRVANREAVIAHSRATYAKPRRYVEEMIAQLNNWDLSNASHEDGSSDTPSDEARTLHTRLMLAGVSRAQADHILAQYPRARIRDQLAWLPLRFAKSPDRFLVAAIEKNFAPPRGMPVPPPEIDGDRAADPVLDAPADESSELPAP